MSLTLTRKLEGELSPKESDLLDTVLKIATNGGTVADLKEVDSRVSVIKDLKLQKGIKSVSAELQNELDQGSLLHSLAHKNKMDARKRRVVKFLEGDQEIADLYIKNLTSGDRDEMEDTILDLSKRIPEDKNIENEEICNLIKGLVAKRTLVGILKRYSMECLVTNVADGPAFLMNLMLEETYPYALQKMVEYGKDDEIIFEKIYNELINNELEFSSVLFEAFKIKIQHKHILSSSVINILKYVYLKELHRKSDCIELFINSDNPVFFNEVLDYYHSAELYLYKKCDLMSYFIKVFNPNEESSFQFLDEIKSISTENPDSGLELFCQLYTKKEDEALLIEILELIKNAETNAYYKLAKQINQLKINNIKDYILLNWSDEANRDLFLKELLNVAIPFEEIIKDLDHFNVYNGQFEEDFIAKNEDSFLKYGFQKKAHYLIEELPNYSVIGEKHGDPRLDYSYPISRILSLAEQDIKFEMICDLAYEIDEDDYIFIVLIEVNDKMFMSILRSGYLQEYYNLYSVLEVCNTVLKQFSISKTFFRLPTDGDTPILYADRNGFNEFTRKYELSRLAL
ncbi:hypothetical protein [Flammeovirga aprica]|uniref:Uncharacterized protein n=1 Tax=Flammeovirga aprica JL-4 TaxID=694437 RepID=A0A7X9RUX7_9BACT|nr:hypothetical protein [Flammeovirga aprica]NME69172.1 hypothetical protein [Flammeovirga aprica JL-4]